MKSLNKYCAEFIGTAVLTLFGCGAAVFGGNTLGIYGIAMAFGLSIVSMAYVIGNISGCHINPAVSFAMLLNKKISVEDFAGYVVSQILGAFAAIGIIVFVLGSIPGASDITAVLGQNGFGEESMHGISMVAALVVEIVLTFVFVFTILGVTSNTKFENISGLIIGLTLTFVHILGIPLTGTSVNPARSIAPAIISGGAAIEQLWVFVVGPLAGAALAAVLWKFMKSESK